MFRRALEHKIATLAIVVPALTLVVGGAYAATSTTLDTSGTVLTGCVNVRTGELRVVASSEHCATRGTRKNPSLREQRITWNKEGRPGAAGAAGKDGADGKDGLPGTNGVDGKPGEPGPAGATGADGTAGQDGKDGLQGPQGDRGPAGEQGPKGADGERGPSGPPGPAGTGAPVLKDANGVSIGTVDSMTRSSVTVVTSKGYLLTVRWDGSIANAQAYYTGAGCTGTAYLNSGGAALNPLYAKTLVYLGTPKTLAVPAVLDASGSAANLSLTASSIDNPDCGANAGARNGWELAPTTADAVGLPTDTKNQLVAPLSLS